MLDTFKSKALFAAGATTGGLLVGLGEGLYRSVSPLYAAMLYGALWALAGLGATVLLTLALPRLETFLGRSLWSWGLGGALSASALVLIRFIILRDIMGEATSGRWKATAGGLVAAGALLALALLLDRLVASKMTTVLGGPKAIAYSVVIIFGFAGLTFAGDDPLPTQVAAGKKINAQGAILVVVDTLRADVLGAYGADNHRDKPASPNIDAFAKEGLLFQDVSAQASWTKPAMASIMTSRHVSGHDTMSKIAALPESLPTLATELTKAGVKTGAVVTNYNLESSYGFGRGYADYRYLAPGRYLGAPATANKLAAYNVFRLLREKLLTSARQAKHFYREANTVNAVGMDILDGMQLKDGDRFFLWLHYMEPHDPYFSEDGPSYARVSHPHPPADWASPMKMAYRDDVRRFDTFFAELRKALKDRGLGETPIILTADHGEEFADHGGFYHGVTLYEEQLHVPLIMAGKGISPGVDTNIARQIDVAPTLLGLFDAPAPASWEGRNLLGEGDAPTVAMAEEDHEGNVLRSLRMREGDTMHKLILANEDNPRGLKAEELYALGGDPDEKNPQNNAAMVQKLRTALDEAQAHSRKGGAKAGTRAMDATAEAELRALGYIE